MSIATQATLKVGKVAGLSRSVRSTKAKRAVKCAAAAETTTKKAPGPLQRGGTLDGDKAAGKDAGSAAKTGALFANGTQEWSDPRWKNGTWDLTQFKLASGETDWDAVIDAEVVHRKALEDCPAVYDEDGLFDTSIVPWWVWVKDRKSVV